jgi:hypothetical protein
LKVTFTHEVFCLPVHTSATSALSCGSEAWIKQLSDKIRPDINRQVFQETDIKMNVLHHVVIKSWDLVITDQIPTYVISVELK